MRSLLPGLRRFSWVPPEVRDAVTVSRHDPLLAAAPAAGGQWVLASRSALWFVSDGSSESIGWDEVDAARWDREEQTLTVRRSAPMGSTPRPRKVVLDAPGDLLLVVRERVSATVVVSRHFSLVGPRGVRVVGRRVPGNAAQPLRWSVSVDRGVDVGDPAVRARVVEVLAQVRAEVGE